MSHFLFVLLYIYSKSASPKPFDIRRTKKITVTIKVFNIRDAARTPKTSKMESFATIVKGNPNYQGILN